jgi:DNA polymerase III epsilon subunit-like protein
MILFFDTETTGLPKNWKATVTDLDNWPRLVQLAYLVYDFDGNLIHSCNEIVKPNGFTIPLDASNVHGITTDIANQRGSKIEEVFELFSIHLKRAKVIVAHNMAYDEKIIGAELIRLGLGNILDSKEKICTMISTVDLCKIDGPYGYKWPKLEELHRFLFNHDFDGAHDALADIQATAKCFWELMNNGQIPLNKSQYKIEFNLFQNSIDKFEIATNNSIDLSHVKDDNIVPLIKGPLFSPCCWNLYDISKNITIQSFKNKLDLYRYTGDNKLPNLEVNLKYGIKGKKWGKWSILDSEFNLGRLLYDGQEYLDFHKSERGFVQRFIYPLEFNIVEINQLIGAVVLDYVDPPFDHDDYPTNCREIIVYIDDKGIIYMGDENKTCKYHHFHVFPIEERNDYSDGLPF